MRKDQSRDDRGQNARQLWTEPGGRSKVGVFAEPQGPMLPSGSGQKKGGVK